MQLSECGSTHFLYLSPIHGNMNKSTVSPVFPSVSPCDSVALLPCCPDALYLSASASPSHPRGSPHLDTNGRAEGSRLNTLLQEFLHPLVRASPPASPQPGRQCLQKVLTRSWWVLVGPRGPARSGGSWWGPGGLWVVWGGGGSGGSWWKCMCVPVVGPISCEDHVISPFG